MHKPWDIFPRSTLSTYTNPHPHDAGSLHENQSDAAHEAVVIIGAGLAGCWLARSLADKGVSVRLIEKHHSVASAASGNPAGIVKPFVTRDVGDPMRFHIKAHRHLIRKLTQLQLKKHAEFNECGVIQLINQPYPANNAYQNLNANDIVSTCGSVVGSQALHFNASGWLNPKRLCEALVTHRLITISLNQTVLSVTTKIKTPTSSENTPQTQHDVTIEDGSRYSAECVVFTTGASNHLLPDPRYLPLVPARGQISRFKLSDNAQAPLCVINGKCYLIPDGDSVLVGATFERHNSSADVLSSDNDKNRLALKTLLPELSIEDQASAAYAGVRATTPDRLPVVGPLPDFQKLQTAYADLNHGKPTHIYPNLPYQPGRYILAGLGSRGITTAAYCAELLADYLCGESADEHADQKGSKKQPTESEPDEQSGHNLQNWASLLNPARFSIRQMKKDPLAFQ